MRLFPVRFLLLLLCATGGAPFGAFLKSLIFREPTRGSYGRLTSGRRRISGTVGSLGASSCRRGDCRPVIVGGQDYRGAYRSSRQRAAGHPRDVTVRRRLASARGHHSHRGADVDSIQHERRVHGAARKDDVSRRPQSAESQQRLDRLLALLKTRYARRVNSSEDKPAIKRAIASEGKPNQKPMDPNYEKYLGNNARNMTFFQIPPGELDRHAIDHSRDVATILFERRRSCPLIRQDRCPPLVATPFVSACSNDGFCLESELCCYDPCLATNMCVEPDD